MPACAVPLTFLSIWVTIELLYKCGRLCTAAGGAILQNEHWLASWYCLPTCAFTTFCAAVWKSMTTLSVREALLQCYRSSAQLWINKNSVVYSLLQSLQNNTKSHTSVRYRFSVRECDLYRFRAILQHNYSSANYCLFIAFLHAFSWWLFSLLVSGYL